MVLHAVGFQPVVVQHLPFVIDQRESQFRLHVLQQLLQPGGIHQAEDLILLQKAGNQECIIVQHPLQALGTFFSHLLLFKIDDTCGEKSDDQRKSKQDTTFKGELYSHGYFPLSRFNQ